MSSCQSCICGQNSAGFSCRAQRLWCRTPLCAPPLQLFHFEGVIHRKFGLGYIHSGCGMKSKLYVERAAREALSVKGAWETVQHTACGGLADELRDTACKACTCREADLSESDRNKAPPHTIKTIKKIDARKAPQNHTHTQWHCNHYRTWRPVYGSSQQVVWPNSPFHLHQRR